MYFNRAISQFVEKTAHDFKAILVTGARQVGKSTMLKEIYPKRRYITFDDPLILEQAKTEPGLFFRNNRVPLVLDEVQYIQELFPYIKMECDNKKEKDLFGLTGSQSFQLMKNVSESLAGRVAIFELAGLSMREIRNDSFNKPFVPTEEYVAQRENEKLHYDRDIWYYIHRGSYPALYESEGMDWQTFYASYVQTYISRDINDLLKIKDNIKFIRFLTVLAARTGQMLNYAKLAEHADITLSTAKEWTSVLEASGIVYILQPYANSALTRAIKTPKIYFRDTGLACYLTKHRTAELASNGALAGALFETFVISEVLKSFSNAGMDYRMYVSYYRGKDKNREAEIDLIIEDEDTIYPVEIKMSANPRLDMTSAFDILDKVKGKKRGQGTVLCMYENPLWLNERNIALPIEYI